MLVKAFHLIKQAIPDCRLEVVGEATPEDAAYLRSLQQLIRVLNLESSVVLRGHMDFGTNLFQLYADSDVLILPSLSGEGTPRVLVEARAFGCPVIATRVGGVESSVRHEVDGLIVPPNNPEAIAQQAIEIASNRPLRERLIDAGRERARQLTVEAFTGKMIREVELLWRSHAPAQSN